MRWILVAGNGPRATAISRRLRHEGFRVSAVDEPGQAVAGLCARPHEGALFVGLTPAHAASLSRLARAALSARGARSIPMIAVCDTAPDAAAADGLPLFWQAGAADESLLLAQLRALLRRADGYPRHHRFGALGLDPQRARVSLDGQSIALRPMEFRLLNLLIEAQGRPVPPTILAGSLWPDRPYCRERLAVQLHHLRRRLGGKSAPVRVQRVKSLGYALATRRISPKRPDTHATPPAL
ncbi:winged helix-turn-helix domain-containing protein [Acidihalobacter prosperus]|uniref:OmpR/PhoB-type domain-containing protein n=1 Tax=Acidihalobacter prosperus TaxID=160660 RepID=A0A1A6C492_9GAMM|nr:winged helix-turn-helix domain-containing protein [Acidihalobacter prosperus]OBS09360.1 hypothetical protein Thpro_021688 [Acidihalobacter prosperus]